MDNKTLVSAYADMLLIRRFEERTAQIYGKGMIGGFCHLYIGQEAVAAGIKNAISPGDSIITSYRCHGLMIAMGSDPKVVMAELMGKSDGCSKGKGGSMHMFDPERGFFGGHGIVGAQVPIGTGIAFAHKYREKDNLSVVLFGDGASNQGQVYESFNMAKIWNLPVIYIIENNEYGMGTSVARSCATSDLYKRGASFEIPGIQADGMNFLDTYEAMEKAVKHVKKDKKGPILLELKTYRYRGHSMSDPATYRSKEEVQQYKEKRDPIEQLKKYLLKKKITTQKALDKIENDIVAKVKEAISFAESSPEPDERELYTDVT